jgi:2-oxo-4-hydroxy-4-carboxy-5-ureidoimidazoline decarboxylase
MSGPAARLNAMPQAQARDALIHCGGSRRWAEAMLARRPFGDDAALHAAADQLWATLEPGDILEAVGHHPRIGAELAKLRDRYAATEQSGVAGASEDTLIALRDGNLEYERRFGHIFIVCATGKSAAEMLAILRQRLEDDPADELEITAGELAKIMHIRLEKL